MFCEQDNIFHAEGNVFKHTQMVFDAAFDIADKFQLSDRDKGILLMSAAFHDIGKPYCSHYENGHIRSHGHSRIGYHIVNEILSKTAIPFEDRLEIINLIKYHGEPNWIHSRKDYERDTIKLSMDCRLNMLYHLACADFNGRIAFDKDDQLINIEVFKEIAEGLNCFYKPYDFSSDNVKFNCLIKESMYHGDIAYDDTKSKVILMSGLPGSGKDTYIAKNYPDTKVVSLDEIRKRLKLKPDAVGEVIQEAKETAKKYLRRGENFIWNATNITRDLREGLITMFNTYNAHITIIYMATPYDKVLNYNSNREAKVPERVIEKMLSKLDIPLNFESHKVIYVS
jgi:putative nucleotidyltransferase with HDIG domain